MSRKIDFTLQKAPFDIVKTGLVKGKNNKKGNFGEIKTCRAKSPSEGLVVRSYYGALGLEDALYYDSKPLLDSDKEQTENKLIQNEA